MIEKTVQDLLGPLVAGRVFFDAAPQDAEMPYIILQQVGGEPVQFLEGPSGSDLARLQIDVYAAQRTEANRVMSRIRDLMATLQASPVGAPVSFFEAAIDARRRSCDFQITAPA